MDTLWFVALRQTNILEFGSWRETDHTFKNRLNMQAVSRRLGLSFFFFSACPLAGQEGESRRGLAHYAHYKNYRMELPFSCAHIKAVKLPPALYNQGYKKNLDDQYTFMGT